MLLTRENDYAIRMLRVMRDGEKHTMKDICQEEEIPEAFAYKIVHKLQKSGMVEVERGASGGCRVGGDL
ncbi:Rrf2 family transcriptional regulator, partial [Clostridioides difficile]|nr:Rrf2 family transcriptional regulator [Clostridioides difficile]